MKKTLLLLLIIVLSLHKISFSQFYIEPFTGYQKDLNFNKNNFLNSGVQVAFKRKNYEFLFQIQKSWLGPKFNYIDSSYTANPALPLNAPAPKQISTSMFSVSIGNRFKIAGRYSKNSFFIKLYTGLMYQKTSVNYQYDKADYIILNPDKTQKKAGIFMSGGFEYMRTIGTGRLFFDLNFSTPPGVRYSYPASYNFVAPVCLNIGYSIKISKK